MTTENLQQNKELELNSQVDSDYQEITDFDQIPDYKPPRVLTRKVKRVIFYSLMIALPFLQFIVFYCFVNFDSIKMAFEIYYVDVEQNKILSSFAPYQNFKAVWVMISDSQGLLRLGNTLKLYVTKLILGTGLALLFSYYVYKKYMLAGAFRVFLYLPSIVSGIAMTLIYQFILSDVLPNILPAQNGEKLPDLIKSEYAYGAILFYNLWLSFGVNVLMYTGTMSGINESIVESAHLDGVNTVQEFWYITVPMIWPTMITFIVSGLATMFTDQMGLYTFFGEGADGSVQTIGYYLYIQTLKSGLIGNDAALSGGLQNYNPNYQGKQYMTYPEISAFGLLITAIILPVTLLVKWAMTKFGPSVD